jgi:NADPH:quinone reductase-like Zn-dependent oxidoreductase
MSASVPATMQVIEAAGFGLDRLRLVERPVPEPKSGETLVRLSAATLNYRDVAILKGSYKAGLQFESHSFPILMHAAPSWDSART